MRSMLVGCALLALGSGAAFAQTAPVPEPMATGTMKPMGMKKPMMHHHGMMMHHKKMMMHHKMMMMKHHKMMHHKM